MTNQTYYTDYPFDFLGDMPGEKAPVRAIKLVSYDQDKYVKITVDGQPAEIKSGYIWREPVSYDQPHTCPIETIRELPLT
jgi:hypothetical protein